jgi:hypothetical protein
MIIGAVDSSAMMLDGGPPAAENREIQVPPEAAGRSEASFGP